jgi:hypothetical protein
LTFWYFFVKKKVLKLLRESPVPIVCDKKIKNYLIAIWDDEQEKGFLSDFVMPLLLPFQLAHVPIIIN